MIRELANGREVDYKGSTLRFPWAGKSRVEVWVAGYGPRALELAGRVGDGFILQLADPDIAAWTIAAVRRGAEAAGRDPSEVRICVAAPAYVADDLPHAREQTRWFGGMVGNHVADIVGRYGEGSDVPAALTDYIAGREGYDYNQHGQAGNMHTAFVPDDDRRPVLRARPGGGARPPAAGAPRARVSTSSPSTCSTTRRTRRSAPTASRCSRRSPSTSPRRPDLRRRGARGAGAPGPHAESDPPGAPCAGRRRGSPRSCRRSVRRARSRRRGGCRVRRDRSAPRRSRCSSPGPATRSASVMCPTFVAVRRSTSQNRLISARSSSPSSSIPTSLRSTPGRA